MNRSETMKAETNHTFKDGLEHIFTELQRIELKILSGVKRTDIGKDRTGKDTFPGPYTIKAENSSVTESLIFDAFDHSENDPEMRNILRSLVKLESDISQKKRDSQRAGVYLPLCELQRLFNLSAFDIDVILMCLLPELDPRFEKYYAYLQDDITRKMPTVNMIVRLLCVRLEDTLDAKKSFDPDAPLITNNLVHIYKSTVQNSTAAAAKFVQIDERIVDYLTERNRIDYHLQSFTHIYQPTAKLQDLVIPQYLRERLLKFISRNKETAPAYFFHGTNGMGKRTTAEAICCESGMPLLHIDVKRMLAADIPVDQAIPLIFREGRLQNAAIYLNRSDLLFKNGDTDVHNAGYDTLLSELANYPHLSFLSSENKMELMRHPRNKLLVNIEFTMPNHSARKQLWQRQCRDTLPIADDVDFDDLANKFRLTAGQIAEALSSARSAAMWRDPENGLITSNDLYLVCRQKSRQRLNTLTNQAVTQYNWDDIILPKDQKEQLIEICNQVKYRHVVYNDWGFGKKLVRGEGLNVLFAGPSGTGKTMAAEIMGNELGIDVYKIDLSNIVSKYIGETEKNLDRIFREGTTANAIIFFDEADSLFGKRSEVRDSHDRYANIEISYLLQKMEDYDGVIILATNLRKNMDEAFTRRMHFAVEFPMPEEPDRYRIWASMFPEKAPLGQDLDLSFLARQFSITGGNIRNIVVASAFLAAQDGGLITMENVIRAMKREYQKMGKLCTENDFTEYFDLVKR